MPHQIKVAVASCDPEFYARAHAISDRIELLTRDELTAHPERVSEVEVAFGGLSTEQMAEAPSLRWIQVKSAGVDWLLSHPAIRESEVVITNVRGLHAESITEHLFGMLLMWERRLVEAWEQQKAGRWDRETLARKVGTLRGKTLGILGFGAIGEQCARVGVAHGMRVLGLRRGGAPHPLAERIYTPEERLTFLGECDVVINLLPLTDRTRGFMGYAEFEAMRPGAVVMNAGRGGTIHTEALIDALRRGKIAAAMLDVTDPEPLPEDHPLWNLENVYITPHYSGAVPDYEERAGDIFLENLRRYVAGEPLINLVDKAEGY